MTPSVQPSAAELDLRVASAPPRAAFEPALVAPTPAWARSAWARAAIALVSLARSLCALVAGGPAAAELLASRGRRRDALTRSSQRVGNGQLDKKEQDLACKALAKRKDRVDLILT